MFGWRDDVPELSGGRVRLRAHQGADHEAMVEMCQDPITRRWASNLPDPYRLADAEWFVREVVSAGWDAGTAFGWAIEAADQNGLPRYAGNLDLRGGPASTVGFLLHPWARGQGIMSAALRLALHWCFSEAGVSMVTWESRVGNVASRRVAWAAGFTFHGTMPCVLKHAGPAVDAWVGTVTAGSTLSPQTRWLTPTVLSDEKVALRPHIEADIPRVVEACSDTVTRHWLSTLPTPYTTDSARAYLDSMAVEESLTRRVAWCIADPRTDLLLGTIAVFDLRGDDPSSGELGYWTHPAVRGRGVMTAAVRLVVNHALRPIGDGGIGLRRLQLLAAAGNIASATIAKRTGFVEVGQERQAELLGDGSYDDLVTFDLLLGDVRGGTSPL